MKETFHPISQQLKSTIRGFSSIESQKRVWFLLTKINIAKAKGKAGTSLKVVT
jgi:hypothetical protein